MFHSVLENIKKVRKDDKGVFGQEGYFNSPNEFRTSWRDWFSPRHVAAGQ